MSENKMQQNLRAENAALRVALRQAQDFCVDKEKKSIEYIFHLGQFKSQFLYRAVDWINKFFNSTIKNEEKITDTLVFDDDGSYSEWLARFDVLSESSHYKIQKHIQQFSVNTQFTLIIDCRENSERAIVSSLESAGSQFYQKFDLVLCGDSLFLKKILADANKFSNLRSKIKIIDWRFSAPTNEILQKTLPHICGDFVAILRAGDQLHSAALYEFAAEIDLYPETLALYADEDELNELGRRSKPYFKSDWNLELFLAQNYIGSFCLLARDIFCSACKKLASQEDFQSLYFYALTSVSRTSIRHVPTVLFHRIEKNGEGCSMQRAARLTETYLLSLGIKSEVLPLTDCPEWVEVKRMAELLSPLVTIIIPTRNRPDLLSVCLRGVLSETNYKNIEIIIVDHENDHPGVLEIFRSYSNDKRLVVMPYRGVFDHSDMNNRAAEIANGDILLFLNDDVEVIEPNWLNHVVAQFVHDDRGVVGARLLYPNRRVQHAGVILGFGGVAGHGQVGLAADDMGYFGRLKLASEVSALTGACMAMKRGLFEEVGGFSAHHLQRTFNDVDLCLKARRKGKINIFTPLATLIHHESATDGGDVKLKHYKRLQREVGYMMENWGLMRADPYYNVNLTLEGTSFNLSYPPRRIPPYDAAGI